MQEGLTFVSFGQRKHSVALYWQKSRQLRYVLPFRLLIVVECSSHKRNTTFRSSTCDIRAIYGKFRFPIYIISSQWKTNFYAWDSQNGLCFHILVTTRFQRVLEKGFRRCMIYWYNDCLLLPDVEAIKRTKLSDIWGVKVAYGCIRVWHLHTYSVEN